MTLLPSLKGWLCSFFQDWNWMSVPHPPHPCLPQPRDVPVTVVCSQPDVSWRQTLSHWPLFPPPIHSIINSWMNDWAVYLVWFYYGQRKCESESGSSIGYLSRIPTVGRESRVGGFKTSLFSSPVSPSAGASGWSNTPFGSSWWVITAVPSVGRVCSLSTWISLKDNRDEVLVGFQEANWVPQPLRTAVYVFVRTPEPLLPGRTECTLPVRKAEDGASVASSAPCW